MSDFKVSSKTLLVSLCSKEDWFYYQDNHSGSIMKDFKELKESVIMFCEEHVLAYPPHCDSKSDSTTKARWLILEWKRFLINQPNSNLSTSLTILIQHVNTLKKLSAELILEL